MVGGGDMLAALAADGASKGLLAARIVRAGSVRWSPAARPGITWAPDRTACQVS
jgi:hypothetical protein